MTLDEVSPDLIAAVLAAEDDSFFSHAGVSLTGIAARRLGRPRAAAGSARAAARSPSSWSRTSISPRSGRSPARPGDRSSPCCWRCATARSRSSRPTSTRSTSGGGNGVYADGRGRRLARLLRQGRRPARPRRGGDARRDDPVAGQLLAGRRTRTRPRSAATGCSGAWRSSARRPGARRRGARRADRGLRPSRSSAAPRPLLRRLRGPGGARAASASRIWRTAATCSSRPSTGTSQKAAQEAVSAGSTASRGRPEGHKAAAPGGPGLDRPGDRRHPRLRRRPRLRRQPVRPRRPGAAPGGERLQAGRLRRRLRGRQGLAGLLPRGRADRPCRLGSGRSGARRTTTAASTAGSRARTALEKSYNPATTRLALQVGMPQDHQAGARDGDHDAHGALPRRWPSAPPR